MVINREVTVNGVVHPIPDGFCFMMVSGRPAIVPEIHAPNLARKNKFVAEAMRIKTWLKNEADLSSSNYVEQQENLLHEIMKKIIRLNQKIPPCVRILA